MLFCRKGESPVRLGSNPPIPHDSVVARRQLHDSSKTGAGRKGAPVGEHKVHRQGIDCGANAGIDKKRLDLRREKQSAARLSVKQRTNPHAVTRQEKGSVLLVPDGERKLAVQPGQTSGAELFVRMKYDLGVRVCGKPMP